MCRAPTAYAIRGAILLSLGSALLAFCGGCSELSMFSSGQPTPTAADKLPTGGQPATSPEAGQAAAGPSYQAWATSYPDAVVPSEPTAGQFWPQMTGQVMSAMGPAEPMAPDAIWFAESQPKPFSLLGTAQSPLWQPEPNFLAAQSPLGGNPSPTQPPPQSSPREPMLLVIWDREIPAIRGDYANYYSWPTAAGMAAGFGIAAGLAESDLDGEIQTSYQKHFRDAETNRIATIWQPLGNGEYTIPVAASLMLLNDAGWLDGLPVTSEMGQWGDRVFRAYLVGAPPMLVMQSVTGGSRPAAVDSHSAWEPFSASNGVSGDAFMSTCLFISAADMTDQLALKGLYYACSFVVPWERVNFNDHFLSQAALGWWMGYLACRAVNETENGGHRSWAATPIVTPEMSGIGVMYQR